MSSSPWTTAQMKKGGSGGLGTESGSWMEDQVRMDKGVQQVAEEGGT